MVCHKKGLSQGGDTFTLLWHTPVQKNKPSGKVHLFTEACLCSTGTSRYSSLEVEGKDTYWKTEESLPLLARWFAKWRWVKMSVWTSTHLNIPPGYSLVKHKKPYLFPCAKGGRAQARHMEVIWNYESELCMDFILSFANETLYIFALEQYWPAQHGIEQWDAAW